MSSQSYYKTLGVAEGATFEEIQSARTKLATEYAEDTQRLQEVEKAYDALLMERLRLRQEGKIDVPDGVRFAEDKPKSPALTKPAISLPTWNTSFSDSPTELWDWLAPTVTYVALVGLTLQFNRVDTLQTLIGIGAGAAGFFVYRKENKVLRAILWSLGGLLLGYMVGAAIAKPVLGVLPSGLGADVVEAWVILVILWVVSLFLK